jgi:Zn-dependent peptidase ImmA (M78 family)
VQSSRASLVLAVLCDLLAQSEDGDPPGHDARNEHDTNEFAANPLMSAAFVRECFATAKSVESVAPRFEVSDTAMRYRLANLGLR